MSATAELNAFIADIARLEELVAARDAPQLVQIVTQEMIEAREQEIARQREIVDAKLRRFVIRLLAAVPQA